MSTGLRNQLAEYGRHHRTSQHPIDVAEVVARDEPAAPLILLPVQPAPSRRRRWAWATAAAVAISALVGGLALLRQAPDDVIDQTTTTVFTPAPAESGGVIEPGSWSIAATFAQPPPAEELASRASEVRAWPGVLEVAEVADAAAWRALTGLDAGECTQGSVEPPCGPGLVALVTSSQIPLTSLRLETEFAMTPLTASDVPGAFIEGYLAAAEAQTGLTNLGFDPASLGVEQPLIGPLTNVAGEECDACELVVQTEVEGFVFVNGLDIDGDPQVGLIHEVSGGGGTGIDIQHLLIDSSGHGGAVANMQAQVGGRAVYGFAFLPLESAVITFELVDGTPVWQRPIAGMALFVDGSGTASDPDEGARTTGRFVVLNATGTEIMHIRGTPEGAEITDLRIDSNLAGATQTDTLEVIPPVSVAGMTLTWTQAQWPDIRPQTASPSGFLGTGPQGRLWRSVDGLGWEPDGALADLDQISIADAGTHLVLSGVQGDGTTELLRSDDGATWVPIAGAAGITQAVDVASTTPSGLTWFRGRGDGGVVALVAGDRITELHSPPWNTGDCCIQIDLVEFDAGVVAFVTDFNEPRSSVAYRYEGFGVWSAPVSVPISAHHAQVGGSVLMFDHSDATCCGNPIPGTSEWPLLESSDGLTWVEIDRRPGEDVHSLKIVAGDSFWMYGPDIGGGGGNIETDPSRRLWISSDGRDWDPVDISFAAPGFSEVLGNTVFLRDGTSTTWIGTLNVR